MLAKATVLQSTRAERTLRHSETEHQTHAPDRHLHHAEDKAVVDHHRHRGVALTCEWTHNLHSKSSMPEDLSDGKTAM